jgi:hypothetical protein
MREAINRSSNSNKKKRKRMALLKRRKLSCKDLGAIDIDKRTPEDL